MPETPNPNRELEQYDRLADICLEAAEDVAARLRQSQDADEIARLVRTYVRLGRLLRLTITRMAKL
jgi:hypothetical protein